MAAKLEQPERRVKHWRSIATNGLHRRRLSFHPPQVLVEPQRRLITDPRPVDLDVGQHLAHVFARFLEGNALDPVHRVEAVGARIAERADPLAGAAGAGVVAGKRQGIVALEFRHAVTDIGRADHGVVDLIGQQPRDVAFDLVIAAHVPGGDGHHLEEPARAGARDDLRVEFRLLARDTEQEGGLGWIAQRRVGRKRLGRIGIDDQVVAVRERRLGDPERYLCISQRIGEVSDEP